MAVMADYDEHDGNDEHCMCLDCCKTKPALRSGIILDLMGYEKSPKGIPDTIEALEGFRKQVTENVLDDLDARIRAFRLKRTGQQEVSIMARELRKKWL